ncbi:MAG: hypothetical protein H0T58_12570 [Gemmatimonadales bacterium]|nr:hypothetical protein [Gemmatimonadales bacterium]
MSALKASFLMDVREAVGAMFIVLAVLPGCRPDADQPNATRPIFRHFNTELSTIQLGQLWTAEEVAGAEPGDTVVALPAETFERAQAVRVHRTPAGVVSSIMFDYPQGTDFQAMQTEYRQLLGPPEHEGRRDGNQPERMVWQDSLTRFELVRDPTRSASTIYTRLSDRSGTP